MTSSNDNDDGAGTPPRAWRYSPRSDHAAQAWGAPPSARYEAIAQPLRPVFERIRAAAIEREQQHRLPQAELHQLRDLGFTRLRLPEALGGAGLDLVEFFSLLIELSEGDPNVTNALRSHFGFIEELLEQPPGPWRDRWLRRIAQGTLTGSGFSEVGDNRLGTHSTTLADQGDHWLANGAKFYTTGSLLAEWIHISASNGHGEPVGALVPFPSEGLEILDDWDGFGQQLSASGTARFANVVVAPENIKPYVGRFGWSVGFFQLVHLAELSGIGRAASREVAALVAERKRVYGGRSNGPSSQDPQVLEVVGRVRAAAHAAGVITLDAARALERAHQARALPPEARQAIYDEAEIEVSQAVTTVTDLILEATTRLFDALGASSARRGLGLDRHWRNARTISSHNPRIYHTRIVGDFAVNGTPPPARAGVGLPPDGDAQDSAAQKG